MSQEIISQTNDGKSLPMAGNNFLIFGSVPFGRNCSFWDASACHCMYHLFMLQMILIFDIFARFPGVKTFCFSLKKKTFACLCRVHHDLQCPLLPSLLTMLVLSNTALMRETAFGRGIGDPL